MNHWIRLNQKERPFIQIIKGSSPHCSSFWELTYASSTATSLFVSGEFSLTGPVSYSTASTPSASATNNVSDSFSSEITLDSPSSVTMDTSFHYEYDSFYGADFVSEFSAAGAYYTPVYWEICSLRREELKNITFYWMWQPNFQKVVFWNNRSKRVWSNRMFLTSSVPNVVRPKSQLNNTHNW